MNEQTPAHERDKLPTVGDQEFRTWVMILHLSQLAGFVIPFVGLVAPIVIWQVKKPQMPAIDSHGKMVVNWLISLLIYYAIAGVLSFIIIGIPLLFVLMILATVFPIVGGIKASEGELWQYPLTIPILR